MVTLNKAHLYRGDRCRLLGEPVPYRWDPRFDENESNLADPTAENVRRRGTRCGFGLGDRQEAY
jgi:hypothetical protein